MGDLRSERSKESSRAKGKVKRVPGRRTASAKALVPECICNDGETQRRPAWLKHREERGEYPPLGWAHLPCLPCSHTRPLGRLSVQAETLTPCRFPAPNASGILVLSGSKFQSISALENSARCILHMHPSLSTHPPSTHPNLNPGALAQRDSSHQD